MSRQKILSSPLGLCLRYYKLSGHPLDFTSCTWHPQVNGAKKVLVSMQTVCSFVSLGRVSPADFETQSCSFLSLNQELKKILRKVFMVSLPGGSQGPVMVLGKSPGYAHLFWGLLQVGAHGSGRVARQTLHPWKVFFLASEGIQPIWIKLSFQKCISRHLLY